MRNLAIVLSFLCTLLAHAEPPVTCADFNALLKRTYGFRPSQLDDAGRAQRSKLMDEVWGNVTRDPAKLAPCLKAALRASADDGWFLFDGGQLLVSVDPSPEAQQLLLDALGRVSLDDVDLRSWVETGASLGLKGLDTSALGKRWLAYPKAEYYVTEHAYHVDRENGAMFLFGALDERFATPALVELCRHAGEQKEIAAWLLMNQATPEALHALKELDTRGLSPKFLASRKAILSRPELIEPRAKPRTTRAEFLSAFTALLAGNHQPFDGLMAAVPDGERDLVAVATRADVDVIRKVRRWYVARGNQHAIDFYNQFTQILMTMVWKPELLR